MTLGNFWPLVAEKAKKLIIEISKKSDFWLFQPPKVEHDSDIENIKELDL